nr:DUF2911 domain-containing protein [uncultured Flavobacterium sp.]
MKKLYVVTAMFLTLYTTQESFSQVLIPQSSAKSNFNQTVGLTEFKVSYSRPGIKGRTVFGELVPYGKLWRTGANENTTVEFTTDVKFGGKDVKSGKYALYTLPKADNWEVILYNDINNWGLPEKWDETKVVARVNTKPESLSRSIENFNIGVNNIDTDYADLELSWEKTVIAVRVTVPTKELAMKSIETTLAGPTAVDYYNSAQYIYQSNGDLSKALIWVNKSIDFSDGAAPFWYHRLKALIQYKLGDFKGAISSATISLQGAEKVNNAEYIKSNTDSIREWSKKML